MTTSTESEENLTGKIELKTAPRDFERRIQRLRELENEISDAPWDYAEDPAYDDAYWVFVGDMQYEHGEFGSVLSKYRETVYDPDGEGYTFTKQELEYLAHARTVLPRLLALLNAKDLGFLEIAIEHAKLEQHISDLQKRLEATVAKTSDPLFTDAPLLRLQSLVIENELRAEIEKLKAIYPVLPNLSGSSREKE